MAPLRRPENSVDLARKVLADLSDDMFGTFCYCTCNLVISEITILAIATIKAKKEVINVVKKERVTAEEVKKLLMLQWLTQKEFATVMDISDGQLSKQLKRGEYKDLYIMNGASRKFNTTKVKRFLGLDVVA